MTPVSVRIFHPKSGSWKTMVFVFILDGLPALSVVNGVVMKDFVRQHVGLQSLISGTISESRALCRDSREKLPKNARTTGNFS